MNHYTVPTRTALLGELFWQLSRLQEQIAALQALQACKLSHATLQDYKVLQDNYILTTLARGL